MPSTKPIFDFLALEIKTGKFFFLLGLGLILGGFLLLSLVTNTFLIGLSFPIIISGLSLLISGGIKVIQNQRRQKDFQLEINEDAVVFHFKETCRIQAFQAYSAYLKLFWSVWVVLGFVIAWLPVSPLIFGMAFGCTLAGAFGQFADLLQQKRVDSYLSTLNSFKGQIDPIVPV